MREQLPGITPACAGRSDGAIHFHGLCKDHPRVCGERLWSATTGAAGIGSPPRVRGEVLAHAYGLDRRGITPACAGRRVRPDGMGQRQGDHPRVCGEKSMEAPRCLSAGGSPPRVRGEG